VGFLFAHRPTANEKPTHTMNTAAPTATPEAEAQDGRPGFEQLLMIYASFGLSPDNAAAAADADRACGWYSADGLIPCAATEP
jgi:hypothetical protein